MKLPLRRATWHGTTIEDADGQAIAHTGSVEDADQFIKCVNTHDVLVAAVTQVLDASEDGGDMDDIDWAMLRAAITKATGVKP